MCVPTTRFFRTQMVPGVVGCLPPTQTNIPGDCNTTFRQIRFLKKLTERIAICREPTESRVHFTGIWISQIFCFFIFPVTIAWAAITDYRRLPSTERLPHLGTFCTTTTAESAGATCWANWSPTVSRWATSSSSTTASTIHPEAADWWPRPGAWVP